MPDQNGAIRLVCFDLGGVIIRICRSWDEGCALVGLDVRDPEGRERTKDARRELIVAYQCGQIDCEEFARRMSVILKGAYTPEEIMAVHAAWIIGEYEGVDRVIDGIHAAALTTACLSNTNHEHWSHIQNFPAFARLRIRLASHELGLHKPDPEIFRAAEQKFGRRGEQVLYFDDLEENVTAAREVGWRAVHIDHAGEPHQQIIDTLRAHGVDLK